LALAAVLAGCGAGGTHASGSDQHQGGARPGGEASIERFGFEARGEQRGAILAVFGGYLGALARKEYPTACSHLGAVVRRSLARLGKARSKQPRCPAVLSWLLSPGAGAISGRQAEGEIARVRAMGDRAFVVFHAPGAKLYMLTMIREGGEWKSATLAASVLVPSVATLR
jgi:hypothetical protein